MDLLTIIFKDNPDGLKGHKKRFARGHCRSTIFSGRRPARLLQPANEGVLKRQALQFLDELDLAGMGRFRSEWKDGPRSSAKKLERLRAFLGFAQKREWITRNPASDLQAPKITLCPTMPYTHQEMLRILAAIDKYKNEFPGRGADNARRIRSLVLLLRYSGMRIGDTIGLGTDRIEDNRLFLYTQKTGVAVHTVLPDFVIKALDATPRTTEKHFFWDGALRLETIVGSWRNSLSWLRWTALTHTGSVTHSRSSFCSPVFQLSVFPSCSDTRASG